MVDFGRRSSGRAAARRAQAALERTPQSFDAVDDEIMADADADPEAAADDDDAEEAHEAADDVDDDDEGEGEGEADADAGAEAEAEAEENADADADADAADGEQQGTDAGEEEDAHSAAKSTPSPPPVMMIRKKRLGRPPKNRPPDWDGMVEVPMSESEIAAAQAAAARGADGTPRRRGRGGWRGRGGRKGQQPTVLQQPIDKDGNLVDVVNDELALPEDPVGETKVDKRGELQGGREYRCRTFSLPNRDGRLYMLSTEPARCVGFRDSYLFFTKHKKLYKIIVGEDEKRDMIEREIIPHSYKGRAIGIVTARSVFREFGALIVVGGRRVTDDYDMARCKEEGAVEGALADPNDHYVPGEPYNKNQYVAWHGASAVYHSGGAPVPGAPVSANAPATAAYKADPKKRRTTAAVTDVNWQLEHAREASNFNSMLAAVRMGATLEGVYDIHTNQMQYPASMQPRRARVVQVDDSLKEEDTSAVFPPLAPQVARNFFVTDIHLETPPAGISAAAYDRYRDGSTASGQQDFLSSFQGLGAVSDDIKDLLPPECRAAFDEAAGQEQAWFGRWGDESEAMSRREPVIDKAIVPYSMAL
ncbi:chromatin structure-remodeling complex protein rsc7 [Ophiostoma piceae UAMH 11346]|uniref:Chromatin structure-remodeling complex protein rsc7 n=1 Tax=Ophiostoma piceae (strain UAMH 11346) TaxID=1262450 RepID=S3CR66_OPHP1|nr:chromatin structure-remodeling complex protein rsc7 [Ophiostoma piceae UAMH 11346]